ncbi:hypothetical protein [Nocardioides baculatus]|uniref:SRPBCC family protein n=1 Tax=Nocardioides baculatus TaxID=2801337 RepID=A0ABS1L8H1_9ACTN|nr:hypothetical protein [Nocardioides baculatus]MBL0747986.1 hypothetical protein [Nocardioides baculatus]
MQAAITDVDPFDLPEWLGTRDVVWRAEAGLRTGHHVRGRLTTGDDAGEPAEIVCDFLAVDEAYPAPVVDDATRLRVHQAWRHGQVVLGNLDTADGPRMVLAVPGTGFGPDLVLDGLGRLARAVGAHAERYAALLRLSR